MSQTYTPETLPNTLTVRVTAEDITTGIVSSCGSCPIATALNRAYPLDHAQWMVGVPFSFPQDRRFGPLRDWPLFTDSAAAKKFINAFDHNLPVAPATFRLRRVA